MIESWRDFMTGLEKSLDSVEKGIDEAVEMREICTSEWCVATEHVLDELSNSLFSISEPRWGSEEDSQRIRKLKHRVHDLYAEYKKTVS
ncbi:MAG: hypothetical protein KQJ78_25210 [Deltaproteobacteria bacterium]|nr:hypothetical protein [Deltaproteobacteria bacterium]